jgi:hypothetical protein
MQTSAPKSPEERVYLRWSNDWFITSSIIEGTPLGDGVTYSATIPAQPDATTCFYSVLTSTVDLTGYTTSGTIDTLTLAVNGIFNALATPPPTPSPTPSPTVTPTPSTTPTPTPTPTPSPTVTPTPSATPTPTPAGPIITQQPANATVTTGQTATFKVTAIGTGRLTYQWQKNGILIPGAAHRIYVTPPTQDSDNGELFSVIVADSTGGTTQSNNAMLTVIPDGIPPAITSQPANATVRLGRRAKFSVIATGSLPLTYQWRKNDVDIPGATKPNYTTPPTTSGDNGALFSVTVTNSYGNVVSTEAVLTVR